MQLIIPSPGDPYTLDVSSGESAVLVGANGAGKTRLGVYLEDQLVKAGSEVHRIGAHRLLTMNTKVDVTSFERAENFL